MIPANVIEDLKYRCDIESFISSYVTLKRTGTNLKGLCPFHSEKTPSFTVYPETQSFYCFGCGAGGDVISFIMRTENLDYVSAIESLAKKTGVTLPDFGDTGYGNNKVSRSRVLEMNLEAAKFYRNTLFDDDLGAPGRKYLLDRGLSSAAIKRFGLGYSPSGGSSLLKHLRSLGFKDDEINTAYFAGKNDRGYYDYFRGRVMFPIIDVSGNVIAFGGRVLDDTKPKYLNTSDTPAFKKTKNLYALNYAKNSAEDYFILCEGYMDVISLHNAGFGMAVASLGTALTSEHARIIKKYVNRVVLCYDSDEAGINATNRAIPILEKAGLEAKVLTVKGAKDPDEFIKKYGAEKFRALIDSSRSKIDFKLDEIKAKHDISLPNEKIKAVSEVVDFLASVYSNVERDIYLSRAAEEFSVDLRSLKNDTEKKRRRLISDYDKKRKGELIRITSGIGDRVNPDFSRAPKAARLEEAVLGMIFIHTEYINRETDGRTLSEDDFITSLGKRLFKTVKESENADKFNIGILNENFSSDEVSRVSQMIAERNELSVNDDSSFDTYVRALRDESMKADPEKKLSLEELIKQKRNGIGK